MPLRVLELSHLAGALCGRLLADLGADVVRVEPPAGAALRRIGPFLDGRENGDASLAHWFYDANKRSIVLDLTTPAGSGELERLAGAADVLIDERGAGAEPSLERLREIAPELVVVRVTPFGLLGPRASWRGSDLVCAARGGMVFVNGYPEQAPIAPFGLISYAAAGVQAAIATLLALFARDRSGRGTAVDVSIAAAAAAAVEHATGFYRQDGSIAGRCGTLHWSRAFRIGSCRDGYVLSSLLGDWTSLAEWVASELEDDGNGARAGSGPAEEDLRDPRWQEFEERKRHCEALFDVLDRWSENRRVQEIVEGAELRRLPYAAVRAPESIARDAQLIVRGFPIEVVGDDAVAVLPGAPFRLARASVLRSRPAPRLGEHTGEVKEDPAWREPRPEPPIARGRLASGVEPGSSACAPLHGVRVLDFTWVVAGPLATRILADHGAEVIKVERRNATDFGSRRGGLTGNLNRGKQSIVLDLSDPRGLDLARRLAARCDIVVDNFSARVMENWGLDYPALRRLREDAIALRLTGFGLDGPERDRVSYGPTLQALVGLPFLMRLSRDDPPAGWGYSWSDMAAGMMAAFAALAALRQRARTGEGQLVDLSQLENLTALLGPRVLDLLRGIPVEPPGNASQEGRAVPHGVYRCAASRRRDGSLDDDRWIAIAVLDDAAWSGLVEAVRADGVEWAGASSLDRLEQRIAHAREIDRRVVQWTRERRAEDLEERLQALGVPAGVVANAEDLAWDAQLRARGYFQTVATPEQDSETFDGVPFVSADIPGAITAPGPLLGEHTDRILAGVLDLDQKEIARLREEGVVA